MSCKRPLSDNADFHVCANHFSLDSFINEDQCKADFAKKLLLKKESVATIHVPAAPPEEVSIKFY